MTNKSDNSSQEQAIAALRDYCLRVIRFLASTALDPHRYFEQKYCGDVAVAESGEEITGILISLVDWGTENQMITSGLASFDLALQADGYPSLLMLCDRRTRPAGLVLAQGRIATPDDYRIIRECLSTAALNADDRSLAERRLNEYER